MTLPVPRHIPAALRALTASVAVALLLPAAAGAQSLAAFEKKVTEFTLDNGLRFILVQDPEAPVITCWTYANVGSVDETKGITGMAHMFEHMAFKGTSTIGTKDIEAERAAMANMDRIYDELRAEWAKGPQADPERITQLNEEFKKAQEATDEFIEHDEFEQALTRAGASGLNASTWYDATQYIVNLPENKLELWMSLESERFLDPVLREFYKERDVVMEERRMRTDNQPIGRLLEEFVALAYKSHPYGEPPIGHMTDIKTYTRREAERFFETYYGPNNLVIAVVGDVDPAEFKALAKTYFGRIPARPAPPIVETVEPEQLGERRMVIEEQTQPVVIMGYHKPDINDPDNAIYDTITDIMSNGRTSRLYKSLVVDQKIAIAAGGFSGLLGQKYPGLYVFFALPAQGHTAEDCEKALLAEIEKMKTEMVGADELRRAKTRARATLIRQLDSRTGLASLLSFYETTTGDWRTLFHDLDAMNQVTAEDVQRVAKQTFMTKNRTVAMIRTAPEGAE